MTIIGAFCLFIIFAIISGSECGYSYSYYSYYYGYYSYSSYDTDCAIYSLTSAGGAVLLAAQIAILVLASMETRRVPKTPNQQIIIVQSPGGTFDFSFNLNMYLGYPQQQMVVQPMVYTGQPMQPMQVAYAQPPTYSETQTVTQVVA